MSILASSLPTHCNPALVVDNSDPTVVPFSFLMNDRTKLEKEHKAISINELKIEIKKLRVGIQWCMTQ